MKKLLSIIFILSLASSAFAQNGNSILKINGSEDGFFADLACRDTVITVNVESSDNYFVTTTAQWCTVANRTQSSFDLVIETNEDGKQRDCIVRVSNSEKMAPIALSQLPAPFLRVNHHKEAVTYNIDVDAVTLRLDIESYPEFEIASTPIWITPVKTDSGYDLKVDSYNKKTREGTVVVASGDLQVPVTIVQKASSTKSPSLLVKVGSLSAFIIWGLFAVLAP